MKIELLAPAGNLEKLKMAILYGADAVYLAGENYGLRASSDNFNFQEMKEGINFAHENNKKAYVTINIIPHNEDLNGLPEYIDKVVNMGADAFILSDPGVFSIVKEVAPNMHIHLSTQANNTNWKSAEFWHNNGVKRIVLARELSLKEIKEIRQKVSDDMEFELFIHGAMCISYSGRCLLSNYMTSRDSNRGLCSHPCRWNYSLVEEKRPGEHYPVFEDEKGTYIFNSKDLCMIEYIPELINSGVSSFKIEGRMKSAYYVATVVRAYRMAIDEYYENPSTYKFKNEWLEEVAKSSHRQYTTGFYLNKPDCNTQIYKTSAYIRNSEFLGLVIDYDKTTKVATIEQRNRITLGDEIEVVIPRGQIFSQKITQMRDKDGNLIDAAPHPQMILYIPMEMDVLPYSIIRRGC